MMKEEDRYDGEDGRKEIRKVGKVKGVYKVDEVGREINSKLFPSALPANFFFGWP